MELRVQNAVVHYAEHGSGIPLVALHGAGVDHREIEAALEALIPHTGYRRIYPDLPGMGQSTAEGLGSNEDVVSLLVEFLDTLNVGPVLLLGHSYGAYLARGIAARQPDAVLGLALLCPFGESMGSVPQQQAILEEPDAHDELEPDQRDGFDEYFVVRSAANARRYRDVVLPGNAVVDQSVLERLSSDWKVDVSADVYTGPTLVVAGRRDSTVGYEGAVTLLDAYPNAALAVIDDAGHALMHERPEILAALVADWLRRAD